MSVISADNKRALGILHLVTEQAEELQAAKMEILELRETNTAVTQENGRLYDELASLKSPTHQSNNSPRSQDSIDHRTI